MTKVVVLFPNPPTFSFVKEGISFYSERLKGFYEFQVISPKVKGKFKNKLQRLKREGEALLKCLKSKDLVVVLDERGRHLSSRDFAKNLETWEALGKRIVFVIGGPEGISEEVKRRADFILSLSNLTLNHELAILVLLEAIYRSASIIRNHPYHRD